MTKQSHAKLGTPEAGAADDAELAERRTAIQALFVQAYNLVKQAAGR